ARQVLPAILGLVVFLAALGVLRAELRAVSWQNFIADIFSMPRWRLGLALLSTVLNYAVLTGYDFLALAYTGKRLPRFQVVRRLVPGLRDCQQGRLCGAFRRVGPLSFYSRWEVSGEDLFCEIAHPKGATQQGKACDHQPAP